MEDAGDATHLDAYVVAKTLPHRLIANSTVTRYGTATAVADKDYLTILLQVQRHRTILPTDNVHTIGFLTTIIGIIGKHKATHAEFRTLEMLNPQISNSRNESLL